MKEFMFYIRNEKDAKKSLTPDEHLLFIKKCEVYIGRLKSQNKLIAAQPLIREGIVISKSNKEWTQKDISGDVEVQVGYYHIRANDMEDAVKIAKENPEFEYVPSASIEVRPVKTNETETGFVYPTKTN
ncbi:MAG: YciI family protein [Bacteroidia bacterium]